MMSYDRRIREQERRTIGSGFNPEDMYKLWRMARRVNRSPVIQNVDHSFGGSTTYYINGVFKINNEWVYWVLGYNNLPLNSFCIKANNDDFFKTTKVSLNVLPLNEWILNDVADIDLIQDQLRKASDLDILTNSAGPNSGRIRHRKVARPANKHWRMLSDDSIIVGVKLGVTWRAIGYGALIPIFRVPKGVWCIQLSSRGINSNSFEPIRMNFPDGDML